MLFVFCVVFLFGGNNFALGLTLVTFSFFAVLMIDNSTARVRYKDLVKIIYAVAFTLSALNIILGAIL